MSEKQNQTKISFNLLAIHTGCSLTLSSLRKSESFMCDECVDAILAGLLCEPISSSPLFPICPRISEHRLKRLALISWAPLQTAGLCLLSVCGVHGIAQGTCERSQQFWHPLLWVLAPPSTARLCGPGAQPQLQTGLAYSNESMRRLGSLEFWRGWRGVRLCIELKKYERFCREPP